MQLQQLVINIKSQDKSPFSEYQAFDYARDFAFHLETRYSEQFFFDCELGKSEAIKIAEQEIAEYKKVGIGGELLTYSIIDAVIDE